MVRVNQHFDMLRAEAIAAQQRADELFAAMQVKADSEQFAAAQANAQIVLL